jgi:phage terminase large subunit-like protein
MAIVAPTLGDASDACVNGPSGLRAHNPDIHEQTTIGGTVVNWLNGSQAKLFGAYTKQDPERLRAGGNRCFIWCEEVAAWRYLQEAWAHVNLGLARLGSHPHIVASTTPRNRPTIKAMVAVAEKTNSLRRATTDDNPSLAEHVRRALYETYGGTRLGRQELGGEMIEDVVGALWNEELIERNRIRFEDAPKYRTRMVVSIDPSWGTTNDEVGIVAGFASNGHAYILEDLSGKMTPTEWGRRAAEAYERLEADVVTAEQNFQAEQVKLVMKTVATDDPEADWTGVNVHFELVSASRGKVLRAEPVVGLYEQGRVHHVGRHAGLEFQMTHWVPPRNDPGGRRDAGDPEPEPIGDAETSELPMPSEYSPDRVDALVFLVTKLLLGSGGPGRLHIPQGGSMRRPGGRGGW